MPRLPNFKEGTFLKAEDLVALVEYVSHMSVQIEDLRRDLEDHKRNESLPELDFNPKVLLFKNGQEQSQYPWSVRYKSGQGAYFEVPSSECKVGVVDPNASPAVEVRGNILVPLRIGRNKLKVDVPFPAQNQYFEIEVKQFAP